MEGLLSSRKNPRIQFLDKLKKRSEREKHGTYLIEGLRELRRAHRAQCLQELYACPTHFPSPEHGIFLQELETEARIPLHEVSPYAFGKISLREGPDGLLGLGLPFEKQLEQIAWSENPLLLVVEGIEKPGNLGALARSADAAGVDAFVLLNPRSDLHNPQCIRASQGAIFSLPIALPPYGEWEAFSRDRAWQWLVLSPRAETPFWSLDLRRPTALILGSEKEGLSSPWFRHPLATPARIPQRGISDSLNVSVAAAVVLYEALRQREVPVANVER
jgi:TrmH family RNA methyltransferase